MNDYDKIILSNGTINKEIYPLIEVEKNGKKIIFYLEEIKDNFNKEDIFIGEITSNNELIPVSEDLLKEKEKYFNEIIEKFKGGIK